MEIKQSGHITDRYRIIRSLGSGGMAEVFLAQDLMLSSKTAVKVIHPYLLRESIVLERFKSEVSITRKINHPGVIKIYEFYEFPETETYFLVMEYLSGGDLKKRIRKEGSLPVVEIVRIGIEILQALEAAHNEGVIHRDIKPHNILFSDDGSIRVTDFGLAKSSSFKISEDGPVIAGTPEYCSPEMIEGGYVDLRADLYSAGITLYEMTTGRLPFSANNPYEILMKHLHSDAESVKSLNQDIPDSLNNIIMKAIEKDPGNRFQQASDFVAALKTMSPGKLIQKPDSYICPECGSLIYNAFPYCPGCGLDQLNIIPIKKGEPGYSVVVTEPEPDFSNPEPQEGEPNYNSPIKIGSRSGNKFSEDRRHKCLEIFKGNEFDCIKLEKKIPRIPFRLINKIDKSSAEVIAAKLAESGIYALIEGKDFSDSTKLSKKKIRDKILKLTPRFYLIFLIFSMGGMNVIMRQNPPLYFIVIGLFLLGIPIGLFIQSLFPQIKVNSREKIGVLPEILFLAGNLGTTSLKKLLGRITGRADVLIQLIRKDDSIDREIKDILVTEISDLIKKSLDWFRAADDLILQNEQLSIIGDNKRIIERSIDRVIGKLLKFSSKLDALTIKLASININKTKTHFIEIESLREEIKMDYEYTTTLDKLLRGEDV